jgi:hypothetical protein
MEGDTGEKGVVLDYPSSPRTAAFSGVSGANVR